MVYRFPPINTPPHFLPFWPINTVGGCGTFTIFRGIKSFRHQTFWSQKNPTRQADGITGEVLSKPLCDFSQKGIRGNLETIST